MSFDRLTLIIFVTLSIPHPQFNVSVVGRQKISPQFILTLLIHTYPIQLSCCSLSQATVVVSGVGDGRKDICSPNFAMLHVFFCSIYIYIYIYIYIMYWQTNKSHTFPPFPESQINDSKYLRDVIIFFIQRSYFQPCRISTSELQNRTRKCA